MEATIPPPFQYVCHQFCNLQNGANKLTIKIFETKENPNITMIQRFRPFLHGPDSLQLHLNVIRHNCKTYKVNTLHIKLVFG